MKQQKYIYLEHRKTKGQRLASLLGMKQKKKLHNFTAILTRFFVAAAVAAAAKLHSFLCLKNGKNAAFKGKKSHIFLIGHLTCYHIQLKSDETAQLLNKPYVNEVTLRGQKQPLKCW